MQPLRDLLHRVRWDAESAKGFFALGYYDRVEDAERIVPFSAITFAPADADTFSVEDENGIVRHIPLHRVRTVYKDGVAIWQRPTPPERN
jgi:uncharacterized protein (UPF0248 family)